MRSELARLIEHAAQLRKWLHELTALPVPKRRASAQERDEFNWAVRRISKLLEGQTGALAAAQGKLGTRSTPLRLYRARLDRGERVSVAAFDIGEAIQILDRQLASQFGRPDRHFPVAEIKRLNKVASGSEPRIVDFRELDESIGRLLRANRPRPKPRATRANRSELSKKRTRPSMTYSFNRPRPAGPFGQQRRKR